MAQRIPLPNKITVTRALTCPFIFLFLIYFFPKNPIAILIALITAIISELLDIADGQIAKRTNQVSQIGKLLDPLSDSLWHNIAYLGLILINLASPWLLTIMLTRDTTIVFTRYSALLNKKVIAARTSGKVKAHALAWYLCLILFLHLLQMTNLFQPTLDFTCVQWPVAIIILFSLFDYLIANKNVLSLK